DDLALEPDHQDDRHEQQHEDHEQLEDRDQHVTQGDVAEIQRIEAEDHARSTRTSVTVVEKSTSDSTSALGWLISMAADPRGTPASGCTGTMTAPRGLLTTTSLPALTPRPSKSAGLSRTAVPGAKCALDGL